MDANTCTWICGIFTSAGPSANFGLGMFVTLINSSQVSTRYGSFNVQAYRGKDGSIGIALWRGKLQGGPVLCRVHSSCFTSEALGALDCDCAEQLDMAMQAIVRSGQGVVFYLLQEGRGAGLLSKARDRMAVQKSGGVIDTFAAYLQLGIEPDPRKYGLVPEMCAELGVTSLRLMTNNPVKVAALEMAGLQVEPVHLSFTPSPFNSEYLAAKARSGHIFDVPTPGTATPPADVLPPDPQTERFGPFLRIASYDMPVAVKERTVWFRVTAYGDDSGGSERLILSHRSNPQAEPILQIFRDRLLERLSGHGETRRQYGAAVKEIAAAGAGSILAIPDDPAWFERAGVPDEHGEAELLRCHSQAICETSGASA